MKRIWKKLGLILMLAFTATIKMSGVVFTPIYSFSDSDGTFPRSRLLLSSNVLYGTTSSGAAYGAGGIFRINIDGTGFTNLHSFDGTNGGAPIAGLVQSGTTLYGATPTPGGTTDGTVFKIETDGPGFSVLYRFPGFFDGLSPEGELLVNDDTLYGTTRYGSSYGDGTVFSFASTGAAFSLVHIFTGSDGGQSMAGLALSGDTLYGTTPGTIFSVKANGTGFTNIYTFGPGYLYLPLAIYTNTDGGAAHSTLAVEGNTLYGTTTEGGAGGRGTVFRINADGTGFTTLHSFEPYALYPAEGGSPEAGVVLSGNRLYGITKDDVIFALNTDGTCFTNLYRLNGGTDGDSTWGPLIISGHFLYGVASFGGANERGTVYALNLLDAIPLNIQRQGNELILSWTNAVFSLQEAASAVGPFSTVQGATSPYTNIISSSQMFYRLQGN